ncbi:MAG: hypothetical protein KAH95_02515 [Spirochaetales bacterium]|nr:hypothetical protein [Spirochaetales bacterium]
MLNSNTLLKIDSTNFDFSDIEFDSIPELELTIDLGHLIMNNLITKTFDDLIKETPDKKENLYILSQIRLMLYREGKLKLINTYNGKIDDSYIKRMTILLNKAGFIDIDIKEQENIQIIHSVKRPLEIIEFSYGFTLREVILPDEIKRCHQYAREFYYYKDLNYDLDVVKPFDLNCDYFAVYDKENQILSLARIVIRTPDHCCPFMFATIAGGRKEESIHFTIPGEDSRIGEVMAIFSAGKKGIMAFKQMMEYLTQYGTTIAHFDSVWTTYDDDDEYTGTYYKNKFIMKETGIKLQYSDFGGMWNLLVTDKISELKNRHHKIFRYK